MNTRLLLLLVPPLQLNVILFVRKFTRLHFFFITQSKTIALPCIYSTCILSLPREGYVCRIKNKVDDLILANARNALAGVFYFMTRDETF